MKLPESIKFQFNMGNYNNRIPLYGWIQTPLSWMTADFRSIHRLNQTLNVLVWGIFGSGKSAFINGMMNLYVYHFCFSVSN